MDRARITVIEDEPHALSWLGRALEDEGYEVALHATGEAGIAGVLSDEPDLILLDLRLPDVHGLDVLKRLRESRNEALSIVMTADSTSSNAIQAMQLGAFEYVAKPIDLDHLCLLIQRALEYRSLQRQVLELRDAMKTAERGPTIIGQSRAMQDLYKLIGRVSGTDATVLVSGESGVGKELVVDAIHAFGKRSRGPLVKVNCAAIPPTLLESELFGHERGAFTDAVGRRVGRFEEADGGLLFLDEVAELPLALQSKLLRVIQDRSFSRLGANQAIASDFRLITATAQDLGAAVREGRFREDLYYRLNVVMVRVPPLRARKEDVPALVHHFLNRSTARVRLTRGALAVLMEHEWPGNVRELENVIARAMVLAPGDLITGAEIVLEDRASKVDWRDALPLELGLPEVVRQAELALLQRALNLTGGNKMRAAELLKIPRRTLYNHLSEKNSTKR